VGSSPRLVVDAVANYMYEMEGDPLHNEWGGIGAWMEEVRARAAEFLGAEKEEIILTRNTTEGMNAVATGLRLKAGDEVLTTNHEHGGGMVCWQYLARHVGVKVRYIQMPNPVENKEQILGQVERHITPRTRVCSFSHVDTITGLQMPMADIARITRPKGILLICDGAQVPGMLDVNVKALNVDTYASSSQKWMLAPKGCGLLYIRKQVQDRVQPVMLYDGYRAYTASMGTRNVPQILGHGVAMDFHNAIGRDRVEARIRQLNGFMRECLKPIPALRLLTPEQHELSSGMVTFAVDPSKGRNGDIVNQLFEVHNIMVKPAQGTYAYVPDPDVPRENYNALRFSTHIFNSEAQIERTADILAQMLA
jgi:selenocysteine lyase/cysteine desulfurase